MYIYDRELSGEPDLGIEQSPLNLPLGAYLHGFAQVTPTLSSPATLAMRPRPFLRLDGFAFDKSLLDRRLAENIKALAVQIVNSWTSAKPVVSVRLVGHTDEVGDDDYNLRLGMRRADAVKTELSNDIEKLSPGSVQGPSSKITIEMGSRGMKDPVTSDRTKRALNRRVEVFLIVRTLPPPPPPPPPPTRRPIDIRAIPEDIKRQIEEKDRRKLEEQKYNQPLPTLPKGKSFKQWLDEKLSDHHVPKWLRDKIWDAIFGKDWGVLNSLLEAAGFAGAEKNAILSSAKYLAESPVR